MAILSHAKDSIRTLSEEGSADAANQSPNGGSGCVYDEYTEDDWPIWEMDGVNAWKDLPETKAETAATTETASKSGHGNTAGSVSTEGDNADNGIHQQSHTSIAECERLFTVPEVYDELSDDLGRSSNSKSVFQKLSSTRLRKNKKKVSGEASPSSASKRGLSLPFVGSRSKKEQDIVEKPKSRMIQTGDSLSDDQPQQQQQQSQNQKGIMRRTSMAVQLYMGLPVAERKCFCPSMYKVHLSGEETDGDFAGGTADNCESPKNDGGNGKRRASILGNNCSKRFSIMDNTVERVNDTSPITHSKEMYRVHFSEVKRVLRVRKFTPEEALEQWWQNDEFDQIEKEVKLLVQDDGTAYAQERGAKPSSKATTSDNNFWWRSYGETRRGLERHFKRENREITRLHKTSKQKVFDEQRRQRLLIKAHLQSSMDHDKIAKIYHQHTAWSRDLALATAASDSDAVKKDFNLKKVKGREFYLKKQILNYGNKVHKHMPEFMMPEGIVREGFLDFKDTWMNGHRDDSGNKKKKGATK